MAVEWTSSGRRTASRWLVVLGIGLAGAVAPAAVRVHSAPGQELGAGTAVDAGVLTGRPTVRPPRLAHPPVIEGDLLDWYDVGGRRRRVTGRRRTNRAVFLKFQYLFRY